MPAAGAAIGRALQAGTGTGWDRSRSATGQRVRGKPRSTFEVPGSGQREVTIFDRV